MKSARFIYQDGLRPSPREKGKRHRLYLSGRRRKPQRIKSQWGKAQWRKAQVEKSPVGENPSGENPSIKISDLNNVILSDCKENGAHILKFHGI